MPVPDRAVGEPFEIAEANVDEGYVTVAVRRDVAGSLATALLNTSRRAKRRNALVALGHQIELVVRVLFGKEGLDALESLPDVEVIEGETSEAA